MSTRLDQIIVHARERSVSAMDDVWDMDRSERVRSAALRRRDVRSRRDRVLRRGLLVAGGAGLLVLALLRGASSAPAEPQLASTASPTPAPTAEQLASRTLTDADAGYAHD
jgi:tRNA A37 N6-isopentenylltransferase MiaA